MTFRYSSDLPEVFKGLDLEIYRGERIGVIGEAQVVCKSTLADLLMGLLPPTEGRLLVDGLDLSDSLNTGGFGELAERKL